MTVRTALALSAALLLLACRQSSEAKTTTAARPDLITYFNSSFMAGPGDKWRIDRRGNVLFADVQGHAIVTRHFTVGTAGFDQISDALGPPIPALPCDFIGNDPGGGEIGWVTGAGKSSYKFLTNCHWRSPATERTALAALARINRAAAMMRLWSARGTVVSREPFVWPPR